MKEIQAIVRELCAPGGVESVLATLVTVQGSSYRRPGARLLVRRDGSRLGSISGGCLEEDVVARARIGLGTGRAEAVPYDPPSKNVLVGGVGRGCPGFVDVVRKKPPPAPVWAGRIAENFILRHPTRLAVVHRTVNGEGLGTRLVESIP